MVPQLVYLDDRHLTESQFIDVLNRATLGVRRPIDDPERIRAMLEHADILCTCWDGELLVGVARSVTDFSYCCYLSDLAVDLSYQRCGIGQELIRRTQSCLHPLCRITLLAAPDAEGFYPRIGMEPHPSAWTILASAGLKSLG